MIPRSKYSRLSSLRQLRAPTINLFDYKKLRGWWPVTKQQDDRNVLAVRMLQKLSLIHKFLWFCTYVLILPSSIENNIDQLSLLSTCIDMCMYTHTHTHTHRYVCAHRILYVWFPCYRANLTWNWSFWQRGKHRRDQLAREGRSQMQTLSCPSQSNSQHIVNMTCVVSESCIYHLWTAVMHTCTVMVRHSLHIHSTVQTPFYLVLVGHIAVEDSSGYGL